MSRCWQLGALMKKNLILMKRSCCATTCEVFFPILLMILLVLIRKAIKIEEYNGPLLDTSFLKSNSSAYIDIQSISEINSTAANKSDLSWNGLTIRKPFSICNKRQVIAAIGTDPSVQSISDKISNYFVMGPKNNKLKFMNFNTINETNAYVKDTAYGVSTDKPELCFGFYFYAEDSTNFNYSLHYFDTTIKGGNQDVPTTLQPVRDDFQRGPAMSAYERWINSGYFYIMKIINEEILQRTTGNQNAMINYGLMAQKYSPYVNDPFGQYIGFMLPFFLIIAYLAPLCMLVFRMVQEKESRAKEGMKIMGLNETVYFFSFFLHWLGLNSIYSIINSLILTRVFSQIGFLYILGFFWLFGVSIFALAYFFQSLMDKTRIAMIISILVYFIMYFVSQAVLSDDVENIAKMFISLLPPSCLQLGIQVMGKFESSGVNFGGSNLTYKFNNYSVSDMYLMFFIDILLYLFLGYYFQNVLSHQFGVAKPFYFLCTKSYWCKKSNKIRSSDQEMKERGSEYMHIDVGKGEASKNNFQSESSYEDKIRSGDCLQINNLKKIFDDGKVAVDGLNLNLYNEEIFALLGHNGAGKSTTISILCGLYEASGGQALYKGTDILEDDNMTEFRKKLGICPQHDVLFENLTVREHLNMFCVFKGVPSSKIDADIEKSLHDVRMVEKGDDLAKNLSGGQKRKLSIAIALIGGSEIVFLDEPSSGMDITSRRNLWEILKNCVGNRIIVLTTHYMEEAAVLGNRIGIVSNGKLKCCGNSLFLIDRFGKYISVNIYKLPHARDSELIKFVKDRIPSVEHETLSEEILFRIPKDKLEHNFSFKQFFQDLDSSVEKLGIKSYGASMPTLEDVFLNVSADGKNKLGDIVNEMQENDVLKKSDFQEVSGCTKFFTDLKCSLKKRFYQIIRDKKTFVLEVLCPILLVLIGLGVSSVQFIKDSPTLDVSLNLLPNEQNIIVNSNLFNGKLNPYIFSDLDDSKSTFEYQNVANGVDMPSTLINYNNLLNKINNTDSYGSFYVMDFDTTNHKYEFVSFLNLYARQDSIIYTQNMMNQIFNIATGKKINVNFQHIPLPLTNEQRKQGESRNNSNLVFFVSVAFALIPASFITIIIKERESNTKHLQIISGISLSSYWLGNYIFELVKYYFIGGVSLLIILAFGNFPYYLWLIYLMYGPAMVSFTYMLSMVFNQESTAQNFVILVNFLFGALGGTVILILRIFEDLAPIGKAIAYILRVIPSFSFAYGYNQLLSPQLLFYIDHPDDFVLMSLFPDEYIIKAEYVGTDVIYLALECFVYLLVLIIWESSRNCCYSKNKNSNADYNSIKDEDVLNEIEKANNFKDDEGKYSIRVRNLEKTFSKSLGNCSSKKFKAVDKLSFCLEFGECFALLGVNGAGKTTTFKSLTCEHLPTGGEIYINGLEVTSNFNKIRNLVGYCPQFDAIFEYMTVYENLDFYANLKGIPGDMVENVVMSLMTEMNLQQYKTKVSGNLSGGNKRKLSVAIAMIGNPPIVLLDEPSTGMDPEARRFMWAVIHKISTRSKKSSVILTTHSMEEAETLCRRMGIMVGGQFKCLGTGQSIKDKYGFGYEIDLRIQNMPESRLNELLSNNQFNANQEVTRQEDLAHVLSSIGRSNYLNQITETGLGREILAEINLKGKITVKRIIQWAFYTENGLKCINKILGHFDEVSIVELWDNEFKVKIKKNSANNSIGFLFGFIEDQKVDCFLSEYSISQTSLEQIFNGFASANDEEVLQLNEKRELKMNAENMRPLLASGMV